METAYCNAQALVFEWDYHLYMKNVFVETCLVYYELVVRISSDIKLTIYLLYIVNFMSEETLTTSSYIYIYINSIHWSALFHRVLTEANSWYSPFVV